MENMLAQPRLKALKTAVPPFPVGQGEAALRAAQQGQTICLVTHGITGRLLILEVLGLGLDRLWTFQLSSTGISELEFRDDWTTLHRMNSLIHLADGAAA